MDNSFKIQGAITFFLSLYLNGWMPTAMANELIEKDAKEAAAYLSYLLRPSMMEPAGSLGSYGLPLSIGCMQHEAMRTENNLVKQALHLNSNSETVLSPRLIVSKGTDWPLSAGLSISQIQSSQSQHFSAFAQLTVFEDLGLPALALRGFWSKAFGLDHTDIESQGFEIAASQGFFYYFNLYVTARLEKTDVGMTLSESEFYGLSTSEGPWRYQGQLSNQIYGSGLRINLDPTVNTSVEFIRDNHNYDAFGLKIGVLL